MNFYQVDVGLHALSEKDAISEAKSQTIAVFQQDEAVDEATAQLFSLQLIQTQKQVRYCKLEQFATYYLGNFFIPIKDELGKKSVCSFYIDKDTISFLDRDNFVQTLVSSACEDASWNRSTTWQFFVYFLDKLIDDDSQYLLDVQEEIVHMEELCMDKDRVNVIEQMVPVRKNLLSFYCYYEQLIDIGEKLRENENDFFNPELIRNFQLLTEKAKRLLDEVKMLREYTVQVRELYQAQAAARQDSIIRTLTIVTAIFFPLSLIASWYGMNFVHMPELKWEYSYYMVIGLSVLVVITSTLIFTKKKIWK